MPQDQMSAFLPSYLLSARMTSGAWQTRHRGVRREHIAAAVKH